MKLSVIIVSYNVKYYVEQCLRAVFKAGADIPMEIFVIDNASEDHTPEYIEELFPATEYPTLHVVSNARNIGFGKANNQAVAKAKGGYILFLNPDTIITENTLHDAIDYADKHPRLGGLGTKMLHSNGAFAYESRRGLPTPWTSFCKMSGLCSLFPHSKTFGRYYMRYLDKEEASQMEVVSGAFFLARRSAIEETGSFDEAFFMYGEDIDLSYRLLKKGYENHYIPSSIIHYKGESTQKSSFKYVHRFYSAMLIFFRKHYHHYSFIITLPIKIAILLGATIAMIAQYARRAKKFIIPPKDIRNYNYIYVGRNIDKVKAVAEKWCLDITFIDGDEKSSPTPSLPAYNKDTAYIIFDTSNFSYKYIVEAFENSEHDPGVGTFYPDSNIIITHTDIFTL